MYKKYIIFFSSFHLFVVPEQVIENAYLAEHTQEFIIVSAQDLFLDFQSLSLFVLFLLLPVFHFA